MNIDVGIGSSTLFNSYKSVLDLFGFSQIISEPTRVTPTTASIIDHVIVSMKDKIKECGVIASGFSDHFITFCSRDL